MKFTYKHYLLNDEIEQYKNDITIIEIIKSYDLGSIVRFTCKKEEIINQIFDDDKY